MNYLDLISKELYNLILSYLDYKDIINHKLQIDYNLLFQFRFFKLYYKNNYLDNNYRDKVFYRIYKYNIELIYIDLLYVVDYCNRFKAKFIKNNKINLSLYYTNIRYIIKDYTIKYLMINNEISLNYELISLIDDVELFDHFINKMELKDYKYFIDTDSNIYRYILETFDEKDERLIYLNHKIEEINYH